MASDQVCTEIWGSNIWGLFLFWLQVSYMALPYIYIYISTVSTPLIEVISPQLPIYKAIYHS